MTNGTQLTDVQLALIDDIVTQDIDEAGVLARHCITTRTWRKWLAEEPFARELNLRIAEQMRTARIALARAASDAAKKLATLASEGKGETARKACLDILNFQPHRTEANRKTDQPAAAIDEATAKIIINALAKAARTIN